METTTPEESQMRQALASRRVQSPKGAMFLIPSPFEDDAASRSPPPFAPFAVLSSGEDVLDFPDDSRAVEGPMDSGGVDQRALGGLENRLDVVGGEDVLLNQNVERRHRDGPADHGRSERTTGEGCIRHH